MGVVNFVLKMTLSGSILFLILLLARPITKKIFSATWNYYMLVATLLVFILPLGSFIKLPKELDYKIPLSIENVSKMNYQSVNLNNDGYKNEIQNNDLESLEDNKSEAINNNELNTGKLETIYKNLSENITLYIWIAGIGIFIIKEIVKYASFNKKLRNLSDDVKENINSILEECKRELNIARKIKIRECLYIKSPMITGILNPVITIPQMDSNKEKLEIVLKHELLHYKRKDLWVKIIALMVNAVNWFNPIVYIIRNTINVSCELSLDEQLVKNMDKGKRKYYVVAILELVERSRKESLIMGTALCKDKKELENRLKKIVYFKKSRKGIVCLSLVAAMLFTIASIFTSNVVFASNNSSVKTTAFAVYVGEDGIYMSDLKENNPVALDIDKAQNFAEPLISRDGESVAYIKNDSLYICNIKTKEIKEVAKNIESYDFDSKNDLIYSTKDPGISEYNIESKKSVNLISNEYKYNTIKCDNKNTIYANKRYEYNEGKNINSRSIGLVSFDLNSKLEKMVLESKQASDVDGIGENPAYDKIFKGLGYTLHVAKISNDDKYLYLWNSPNSGSTSSDINQFAVYDIVNSKLIDFKTDTTSENDRGIYGLHYEDNISQNPLNSDIIAFNEGVNRDMFENKNLGVADIKSNKFVKLLPENQVSMTPCYSDDGKNILYSATDRLDGKDTTASEKWRNQPHNIYQINTETQKITQVTNGQHFDFMPKYILNDEILFVRADGDSFSLWKTKNGEETKLGDSVGFNKEYSKSWYYGHYNTERVIDVFVK